MVGGVSLTYAELEERVARWRGGLAAAGVGPDDRVAVVSGNDLTFVLAHLAVVGCGATSVPLNPRTTSVELTRELAAAEVTAAVVGPDGRVAWSGVAAAERPPELAAERLDGGDPAPVIDVADDDPAVLLFTSGTAGWPRPAVLTHGNLEASIRSLLSLDIDLVGADHVLLTVIPLFHVFGLNTVLHLGLAVGACVVAEDFTTTGRVAELVEVNGVTVVVGPPNLWWALARDESLGAGPFATVRLAVSGAAKLQPEVAEAVAGRFGLAVVEGYGLTETCATVAAAAGVDAPVGSVGPPMPGVEVRLVDGDGHDVLVGDPGELLVRGPMVSPGYRRAGGGIDPLLTLDGWLATGDVAVVDEHGHLSIVDRSKDIVIVSGFNVYPAEIEAVLATHPAVADVGVVGEPDEATGERLVAHVVPSGGADPDVGELLAHCEASLARYKVPKRIELTASLPVGAVGKLRRRELRRPDGA